MWWQSWIFSRNCSNIYITTCKYRLLEKLFPEACLYSHFIVHCSHSGMFGFLMFKGFFCAQIHTSYIAKWQTLWRCKWSQGQRWIIVLALSAFEHLCFITCSWLDYRLVKEHFCLWMLLNCKHKIIVMANKAQW